MAVTPVKTRFAPSPTGLLHLGNARTALFNLLFARGRDGVFLLRVEDTAPERSREEFLVALEEDLRWLGIIWQEGDSAGGELGPYRQSERGEVYRAYFERLFKADTAYPCFCTPRELELSRKAQRAAGRPPRYAGTCARLSRDQAAVRLARGDSATLRFRVPDDEMVVFDDLVRGRQQFRAADIGDFVIRRANGSPAFFFSNAVDDALMEVTHVLRGDDHLANTPRQILLLRALALKAPDYGHISLIVAEDGAPLSKRQGSASVQELREQGYLPAAVVNYLARLGHSYTENDLLNVDTLGQRFEPARLVSSPARFDVAQLRHWQREAMTVLSATELWERAPAQSRERVPAIQQAAFLETVRENVLFPAELAVWSERLFAEELEPDPAAHEVITEAGQPFFEAALGVLDAAPRDFKAFADGVKAVTGAKGKALFKPLRAALSGTLDGPEMRRIYDLLGPDRARRRLASARNRCPD